MMHAHGELAFLRNSGCAGRLPHAWQGVRRLCACAQFETKGALTFTGYVDAMALLAGKNGVALADVAAAVLAAGVDAGFFKDSGIVVRTHADALVCCCPAPLAWFAGGRSREPLWGRVSC